jgi:hypothetical protein
MYVCMYVFNPTLYLYRTHYRFSFQLEKRHLSTIHLNAIARIYGDHGEEILELLRRNPAGRCMYYKTQL